MRVLVAMAVLAGCSYDTPTITGPTSDAEADSPAVSDGPPGDSDPPPDQLTFACDGPEDCNGNQVCCNNGHGSSCRGNCNNGLEVCHTADDCGGSCSSCAASSNYGQPVCCE